MIQELVNRWEANKSEIEKTWRARNPENYLEIVKEVVKNITSDDYGDYCLDPERIHEINDGDYQGTLLYVIGEKGYQPSTYYYVSVGYGSCSVCDTLQAILMDGDWNSDKPTENQTKQYMQLSLHVLQGIKRMGEEE